MGRVNEPVRAIRRDRGAVSTSSNVSTLRVRRTPCTTASRCRSWLPSTTTALSPQKNVKRNTCRKRGRGFYQVANKIDLVAIG